MLWKESLVYLLAIWELYCSNSILFDLLNSSIREYAFFFTIWEYTLYGAIWKTNFFSSINKMLLNLIIWKLEDLESIRESCLSSLSIWEVINDFLVWECLLNIIIIEVYYRIAITPNLSLNTVSKDNFFLSSFIDSLDLSIVTNDFFK